MKQSKQTSWEEDLYLSQIEDFKIEAGRLKQELFLLERDYYECKEELSKMTVPKELIISIGLREYTYRREK